MAARGIVPSFKLIVRRNQQIKLFKSMHAVQLTQNFLNNRSSNGGEWKCDIICSPDISLIPYNLNSSIVRRWKYSKKQKSEEGKYDSDDEDEDESEDLDSQSIVAHNKNAKILNQTMSSMRIDAIVKTCLGIARNKAEIALYEGKLRVNGKKPLKKGLQIGIDDVIDFVHGPSPKNEKFLLVTRITILDAKLQDNNYKVKMLREKSLVIENYVDSWQPVDDVS